MSRRGTETFLTGFIAFTRYGPKPRKGQVSAARRLAEAVVEKVYALPEDPVAKTRKREPRR